jgi:hypothetical protein
MKYLMKYLVTIALLMMTGCDRSSMTLISFSPFCVFDCVYTITYAPGLAYPQTEGEELWPTPDATSSQK